MKTIVAARLTLVFTATLAALALQLAQYGAGWTVGCLAAGLLANLCIDQFRLFRPLPSAWAFVPILLAATACFVEWQWNGPTSQSAAIACVHFILLSQIASFYSDLAGPQIGMSLAGSMVLLLVAVKRQPSPWHLPLVVGLVAAATASLIFRAIMVRENEYQNQLMRLRSGGQDSFVPADRRFPGRMALVTVLLSLAAAGIGLFGFFFLPRVSFAANKDQGSTGKGETPPSEVIRNLYPRDSGRDGTDRDGPDGGIAGITGYERGVKLKNFGPILTMPGQALRLTREKIDASKPLPGGVIYLRGTTLSHYAGGGWRNERRSLKTPLVRRADDSRWYRLDFEKEKNHLLGAGVSEILTVDVVQNEPENTLFVPGAADGLESTLPGRPERDSDGAVLLPTVPPTRYRWLTQVGSPALDGSQTDALAHPFGVMTGLHIAIRPALAELAGRAVGGARTDQAKALAIQRFLRDAGEYAYTLDIPRTPENFADPIEYFLVESKRGHCAYFATGFVVLARLNKLACRLATGYSVRAAQDQTTIDVNHADAHAWVEVYIANKGWVTLDPTPAGANARAVAAAAAGLTPGGENAGNPNPTPGTAPDPKLNPEGNPPGAPPPEPDPITGYSIEQQTALYEQFLGLLNWELVTLAGVSLRMWHLLVVSLLALLAWRLRHGWRSADEFELAYGETARGGGVRIAFYRRMLAIQKSRGYVRSPNQSATEFAYLAQRRGDPGAKAVALITNVYLLMRFGALPEADRRTAWQRYRGLVEDRLKDLELLRAVEKAGGTAQSPAAT